MLSKISSNQTNQKYQSNPVRKTLNLSHKHVMDLTSETFALQITKRADTLLWKSYEYETGDIKGILKLRTQAIDSLKKVSKMDIQTSGYQDSIFDKYIF